MNNLTPFILRSRTIQLKKAITLKRAEFIDNLPMELEKSINLLAEWAGKYPYCQGYKIKEDTIDLITCEFDYGRELGIGVFLEGEKHDDLRGMLLLAFETANDFKEQNNQLRSEIDEIKEDRESLKNKLKELFPDMFPILDEGEG